MKKILFLGSIFLALPVFAQSSQAPTSMCIQVTTHAVDSHGICKVFSTPCDVPEGWRVIPSCDLIKDPKAGASFEEVQERRRLKRVNWAQATAEAQKNDKQPKRVSGTPRIGRSAFTKRKAGNNQRLATKKSYSFVGREMNRTPKFGDKEAYERYKSLNYQKRTGFREEGELTPKQEYQQRIEENGQRRPGWITSSEPETVKEAGSFASGSYYDQRAFKRDLGVKRPTRYWKPQTTRKRKKKEPKVLTNRRGWVGGRRMGDGDLIK